MLKIGFSDQRPPVWILEKRFVIGSAPNCHLVLDHASVNPVHARLFTDQQQVVLQEADSDSVCLVNGKRATRKLLGAGDIVQIGELTLTILEGGVAANDTDHTDAPWLLVADNHWLRGMELPLGTGEHLLGRSKHCSLSLPGTHLAREHARLEISADAVHIHDLGSSSGTYINDERISRGTAHHGDRLRFDIYSFHLLANTVPARSSEPASLQRSGTPEPGQGLLVPRSDGDTTGARYWITRPTSPGNRIEAEPTPPRPWLHWLSVGVCVVALLVLCGLLLTAN